MDRYLNKNKISTIEGLEWCEQLEELYVSDQDINEEMTFDLGSLAVISKTLRVLECDNNNIKNPGNLAYLSIFSKFFSDL
jgi:hypothetical protein